MKKLIAILLISPFMFAEEINLACETYSTFEWETKSSKTSIGSTSLIIDTAKKIVSMNGGATPYKENGNKIIWTNFSQLDIGDETGMAWSYYLDRVSRELEIHFATQKFNNGFQGDIQKYKLENYKLGLIHSAKCEKAEVLF